MVHDSGTGAGCYHDDCRILSERRPGCEATIRTQGMVHDSGTGAGF